ncbi:MAG TPA: cob(I)yrinic acid a,c-diamide adenosyltransferase [Nitrososphaeraceae archaeon]|jgi:cob(I)alamin adenosyltransferase|nr:cob(I)yrinic acid a,c-diamide adenosyltransferase [Nitrososphaeraceae archaeon]
MKIYTKTGDLGETGLIGGRRIPKNHARIIAYGSVDELNSSVGLSLVTLQSSLHASSFTDFIEILSSIQNDLFTLGADLANDRPSTGGRDESPRINEDMISRLESTIDVLDRELAPISFFILPGGSLESGHLHLSRSIARRSEVSVVGLSKDESINPLTIIYLNRLSDLFFVMARTANKRLGIPDNAWKKTH